MHSNNIVVHTTDGGFTPLELDDTAPTIPASHGDSTDPVKDGLGLKTFLHKNKGASK